jgi:hypothetical protein
MAVSKKGMRKVKVKGKHFLWHVKDNQSNTTQEGFVEYPLSERFLHIISADKRFIVHYRIPKPGDSHTELHVEGTLFPRAPSLKEIEVPRWRHDGKLYPTADFVRRLIGWCLDETGES